MKFNFKDILRILLVLSCPSAWGSVDSSFNGHNEQYTTQRAQARENYQRIKLEQEKARRNQKMILLLITGASAATVYARINRNVSAENFNKWAIQSLGIAIGLTAAGESLLEKDIFNIQSLPIKFASHVGLLTLGAAPVFAGVGLLKNIRSL